MIGESICKQATGHFDKYCLNVFHCLDPSIISRGNRLGHVQSKTRGICPRKVICGKTNGANEVVAGQERLSRKMV